MSFDKNYDFFTENLDALFKRYGDAFVVIKNKEVIGSYPSFMDAFTATLRTEKLGTFIIQQCADDPEKLVLHFQDNVGFVQYA
jgi:hypothetical protein